MNKAIKLSIETFYKYQRQIKIENPHIYTLNIRPF